MPLVSLEQLEQSALLEPEKPGQLVRKVLLVRQEQLELLDRRVFKVILGRQVLLAPPGLLDSPDRKVFKA